MDGCKKSAVVFESVVSSCEFINCQSVQMQVEMMLSQNIQLDASGRISRFLVSDWLYLLDIGLVVSGKYIGHVSGEMSIQCKPGRKDLTIRFFYY